MVKLKPMLLGMAVFALVSSTLLFVNHARANRDEAPTGAKQNIVGCTAPECIIYDISTQSTCTESGPIGPTYDLRWVEGLSLNVDQSILGGEIVAFKLQWFNGTWSDWYVPGVNDIDIKYNTDNNTMRRLWAYFYDHTHSYITCTN